MASASAHKWRFFRAGGFDQVRLDTGADLLALDQLDQKLWVALMCPTTSIAVDPRTLALLDTDNDKRVRAPELISAAKWAGTMLKNPDQLLKAAAELRPAEIANGTPEGAALHDAASRVLRALGKPDDAPISVADASDAVKALYASPLNGDGIIVEKTTESEELRAVIRDIAACKGGELDRSGVQGITQPRIDAFFADVTAYVAWREAGEADKATAPLGEDTAAGRARIAQLKAKIDDYFARCRLAAFDARAAAAMNRDEKEFAVLALKQLTVGSEEIAAFPLAHVEAGKPLPLVTGLNPAWDSAVADLRTTVIQPLLGKKDALTEAEWTDLQGRFAAYDAWTSKRAGTDVEKLGIDRLRALAAKAPQYRDELTALVAQDVAIGPVATSVAALERLARFNRDLYKLANNFVSFRDFYTRQDKAAFQAGTLYLDQRSCELCIQVEDPAKHALMAPLARTFLAYCDCHRDGKKLSIVAAFTDGDSDNLMVGRNGIFYDREGKDWDATITKIVDNPISIRQAFWSPYKKLIRFIEDQVAKRAAAADTASTDKLTGTAAKLGTAAETGKAPEPAAPKKLDIGVVAALGVAVGGLTAALGVMMEAFFGLGWWMPLGVIGLLLAISGPSMAVAWLKLRRRSLAALLDANGWAVNAAARINIPFGRSLTQVAELPEGSTRDLRDPYREKGQPWALYATAAALILIVWFWGSGRADPFLPENARRATVFPSTVSAPVPAAAPGAPTPPGTATTTPP